MVGVKEPCHIVVTAVILLATAIPSCSPRSKGEAVDPQGHQHPSCVVGALLRRQGDLGEAVAALEVCRQQTQSITTLRCWPGPLFSPLRS